MAEVLIDKPIRRVYPDSIVISNVKSKIDNNTTSYTVVLNWYDGSAMDDSKVDQWGIYTKYKETGEYLRENKPNWGELFLEIDTVAELRDMSPYNQYLLWIGYYRGVRLGGYYEKGDTPGSLDYFISKTNENDDGGSIFEIGNLKFEHKFYEIIDVRYFGAMPNNSTSYFSVNIQRALDYISYTFKVVFIPSGVFYMDRRLNVPSNTHLKGAGKYLTILERKLSELTQFDGIAPKFPSVKVAISDLSVTGFRSLSGDNKSEVYGIVSLKCDGLDIYNIHSFNNQSAGIRIGYHSILGHTTNFRVHDCDIENIWSGHGIEVMRAEDGMCYGNKISNISEHAFRLVGCSFVNVFGNNLSDFGLNGVYFGAFGGSPGDKYQYDVKAYGNTIKLQRPGSSGAICRSNTFNSFFYGNNVIGDGVSENIVGVRFLSTEGGFYPVDCKAFGNKIRNVAIGVLYDLGATRCHTLDNEIKNTFGGYAIFAQNAPANFNGCHIAFNKVIQDNDLNQKGIVFTSNSELNVNYIYSNDVKQRILNDPVRVTGIGRVLRSMTNNDTEVTRIGNSLLINSANLSFLSNLVSGTPVMIKSTGDLPSPLLVNTIYYSIWNNTTDRFRLAISPQDALNNIEISLSSPGTGTVSVELAKNGDTNIVKKI